ncbi:hypothetical protein VP01_76g10 [Puccinia sorghi]|uniref:Uncharacterized protein n=1 Tax=Puccinia sorghi TaxID=27349 RepID=A0A0L6UCF2_9BASI|nr:hypothetical protein VP01_76g10 [Puccinia sorghi]
MYRFKNLLKNIISHALGGFGIWINNFCSSQIARFCPRDLSIKWRGAARQSIYDVRRMYSLRQIINRPYLIQLPPAQPRSSLKIWLPPPHLFASVFVTSAPTYGNNQSKESVWYWKRNSATHKQHLEELHGSGRKALSAARTNGSEWANQQQSGIIINNLRPSGSKNFSGNALSAAHADCSQSENQKPSGVDVSVETRGTIESNIHTFSTQSWTIKSKSSIVTAQIVGSILLCTFQYLFFHLSQASTNATLQVLKEITTLENSNNNPEIRFPIMIETIISHLYLTPKIHTQTCCPQCFSLYQTDNTSSQCSFSATPKSQLCESSLSDLLQQTFVFVEYLLLLFYTYFFSNFLGNTEGVHKLSLSRSIKSLNSTHERESSILSGRTGVVRAKRTAISDRGGERQEQTARMLSIGRFASDQDRCAKALSYLLIDLMRCSIVSQTGRRGGGEPSMNRPSKILRRQAFISIVGYHKRTSLRIILFIFSCVPRSEVESQMLIIKASLVVAILSSLVVLEAADDVEIVDVYANWFDLEDDKWSEATVFTKRNLPVTVRHPTTGAECLHISRYTRRQTSIKNVGQEPATYVLRDGEGLSTQATTIQPGKLQTLELEAYRNSIFIQKQ